MDDNKPAGAEQAAPEAAQSNPSPYAALPPSPEWLALLARRRQAFEIVAQRPGAIGAHARLCLACPPFTDFLREEFLARRPQHEAFEAIVHFCATQLVQAAVRNSDHPERLTLQFLERIGARALDILNGHAPVDAGAAPAAGGVIHG